MKVVVVTGLERNKDAMAKRCTELKLSGFKQLTNYAVVNRVDRHPHDIERAETNEILCLHKLLPNGKFFITTNSDHIINVLRVMRNKGEIDDLEVRHFGPDGTESKVEVGPDGEPDAYPDGFLDEWKNLMRQLHVTKDWKVDLMTEQ